MLVLIEMLGWFATVGAISKFLNLVMIGLFLSASCKYEGFLLLAAMWQSSHLEFLRRIGNGMCTGPEVICAALHTYCKKQELILM